MQQECFPMPLSLCRNSQGIGSDVYHEGQIQSNLTQEMVMSMQKAAQCPDTDIQGEYFSVSFRKGPYMNK